MSSQRIDGILSPTSPHQELTFPPSQHMDTSSSDNTQSPSSDSAANNNVFNNFSLKIPRITLIPEKYTIGGNKTTGNDAEIIDEEQLLNLYGEILNDEDGLEYDKQDEMPLNKRIYAANVEKAREIIMDFISNHPDMTRKETHKLIKKLGDFQKENYISYKGISDLLEGYGIKRVLGSIRQHINGEMLGAQGKLGAHTTEKDKKVTAYVNDCKARGITRDLAYKDYIRKYGPMVSKNFKNYWENAPDINSTRQTTSAMHALSPEQKISIWDFLSRQPKELTLRELHERYVLEATDDDFDFKLQHPKGKEGAFYCRGLERYRQLFNKGIDFRDHEPTSDSD